MLPSAAIIHRFAWISWNLQCFCLLKLFFVNYLMILENCTRIFIVSSFSISASFSCFCSLKLSSVVCSTTSRELLTLMFWVYDSLLPRGSFMRGSFESMTDGSPNLVKETVSHALKIRVSSALFEDRVALQPVWRGLLLLLWYHDKLWSKKCREKRI